MIQPSRHLLRRLGSFYLQWLVSRKAFEVISRIRLQLMIRNGAKASLLATNESLDRLTQSREEVRNRKGKKGRGGRMRRGKKRVRERVG